MYILWHIYISWNIIKKFKFVFDAFVKIRVIELDVYSNYKRLNVVLFPHFPHWEQREDGWFNNKVTGMILSSRAAQHKSTKLKYEKYVLIKRRWDPFSVPAHTITRWVFWRPRSPSVQLWQISFLVVLVLRVTVLPCGKRTSDRWH